MYFLLPHQELYKVYSNFFFIRDVKPAFMEPMILGFKCCSIQLYQMSLVLTDTISVSQE